MVVRMMARAQPIAPKKDCACLDADRDWNSGIEELTLYIGL